jgi:NADH-quinone oxidoreductase subunit L
MTLALILLTIPTIGLGFVPFGHFVHRGPLEHAGIHWAIAGPAILFGGLGIVLAFFLYSRPTGLPARFAAAGGDFYSLVYHKFYFDELYLFVTHRIIFRFVSRPIAWFDRHVVDGAVNGLAWTVQRAGSQARRLQSGVVQNYVLVVFAGVAAIIVLMRLF